MSGSLVRNITNYLPVASSGGGNESIPLLGDYYTPDDATMTSNFVTNGVRIPEDRMLPSQQLHGIQLHAISSPSISSSSQNSRLAPLYARAVMDDGYNSKKSISSFDSGTLGSSTHYESHNTPMPYYTRMARSDSHASTSVTSESSFHSNSVTNIKQPFTSAGISAYIPNNETEIVQNEEETDRNRPWTIPKTQTRSKVDESDVIISPTERRAGFVINTFTSSSRTEIKCEIPLLQRQNNTETSHGNFFYDPEDILYECAKQCNIQPLYVPLFGLWNKMDTTWTNLGHFISFPSPSDCYEFRVRFTVHAAGDRNACRVLKTKSDEYYPVMSKTTLSYLFYQRRHQFLNKYPIPLPDEFSARLLQGQKDKYDSLAWDEVLTAAALDFFAEVVKTGRKNNDKNVDVVSMLPISSKNDLDSSSGLFQLIRNYLTRYLLRKRFHQFIKSFSDLVTTRSAEYYHQNYITYVEKLEPLFNSEIFDLDNGEGVALVNGDLGVKIVMLNKCFPKNFLVEEGSLGFQYQKDEATTIDSEEVSILKVDFKDLGNLTLLKHGQDIYLSDIVGNQLTLRFSSAAAAIQFASCVEGYCRLLVDPNCTISPLTCPRSIRDKSEYLHGPVSRKFVRAKLSSHPSKHACVYRHSSKTIGEFELTVKTTAADGTEDYKTAQIKRDDDGNLHFDSLPEFRTKFRSMSHLVESLSSRKYAELFNENLQSALENVLRPTRKDSTTLLIQRHSEPTDDNKEPPRMKTISEKDIAEIIFDKSAFSPTVTFCNSSIRKYYKHDGEQLVRVTRLIPCTNKMLEQHAAESFEKSLVSLFHLRHHRHVIKQLGVTSQGGGKVLESSKWGNIIEYLKKRCKWGKRGDDDQGALTGFWTLQVYYQIAHALNYLATKNIPHGRLCGEKVILFQTLPTPIVKLEDAGVTYTLMNNGAIQIQEPILKAPWLASEFCCVRKLPPSKYDPSHAGDIWSFFTTLCEIENAASMGVGVNLSCSGLQMDNITRGAYADGNKEIVPVPEWIDNLPCDNDGSCDKFGTLLRRCWSRDPNDRPHIRVIFRQLATLMHQELRQEITYSAPDVPTDTVTSQIEPTIKTYQDIHLRQDRKLGNGAYGVVWQCVDTLTGEKVAVKEMTCIMNRRNCYRFNQEIKTMLSLRDRNVVQIKGITLPSERIVMEYLELSSLDKIFKNPNYDHLKKHYRLTDFAIQIAQGVYALHQNKIIHRDLALRNTLLAIEEGCFVVKISDFGLSCSVKDDKMYCRSQLEMIPTISYAPECLKDDHGHMKYRYESDVWSYGITLWELYSHGMKPNLPISWSGVNYNKAYYEALKNGKRLPRPKDCDSRIYANVMKPCWEFIPEERISLQSSIEQLKTYLTN